MSKSRTVAFYGVTAALVFVLLFLETYVFQIIPLFNFATPAIFTLPFAFALSMFRGKKSMFFGGTCVGVCSLIIALILGNPVFINPVISVLPRVLCGLIATAFYMLIKKLCGEKKFATVFASAFGGAAGVLMNTVLVLFTMFLFQASTLEAIFATLISINFVCEFAGAIILAPVFVTLLQKYAKLD